MDSEPFNWPCVIVLLACFAFWGGVIYMAVVALDWLLICIVIGLVIAVYFVVTDFIDQLIDYWRSYRND